MLQKLLFFTAIFFISHSYSQTYSAKIVDAETQLPIPFAAIQAGKYHGVVSNSEGIFSINISEKNKIDSLTISCLGYKTLQLSLHENLEKIIPLTPEAVNVIPVFLETKNLSAEEIMENVKENLKKNYDFNYVSADVFTRNNGSGTVKKFDVIIKNSTLENINQHLMDSTFAKIKRKFVYLNEGIENVALKNYDKGQISPKRKLFIQNKEEIGTGEKLQADFMKVMEENFKSDSQLIIKTGIIRLDKTKSVDSILNEMKRDAGKEMDTTEQKNKTYPFSIKNVCVNKNSEADFVFNPDKYIFKKTDYALFNNDWVYILTFEPKKNAKFKGKLYVNTTDFAILKAEYQNSNGVYDKIFNLLGVHLNKLSYSAITLFNKENEKYRLIYFQQNESVNVKIDRPLTVVEKNDQSKGKKRINKVEAQFELNIINSNRSEIVFSNYKPIDEQTYANFKPNEDFISQHMFEYDKNFWNGYNILTPEKAIQEIKIEE